MDGGGHTADPRCPQCANTQDSGWGAAPDSPRTATWQRGFRAQPSQGVAHVCEGHALGQPFEHRSFDLRSWCRCYTPAPTPSPSLGFQVRQGAERAASLCSSPVGRARRGQCVSCGCGVPGRPRGVARELLHVAVWGHWLCGNGHCLAWSPAPPAPL